MTGRRWKAAPARDWLAAAVSTVVLVACGAAWIVVAVIAPAVALVSVAGFGVGWAARRWCER